MRNFNLQFVKMILEMDGVSESWVETLLITVFCLPCSYGEMGARSELSTV